MAAVEDGFDHAFKDPLWKDIALDDSFRSLYLHAKLGKVHGSIRHGMISRDNRIVDKCYCSLLQCCLTLVFIREICT